MQIFPADRNIILGLAISTKGSLVVDDVLTNLLNEDYFLQKGVSALENIKHMRKKINTVVKKYENSYDKKEIIKSIQDLLQDVRPLVLRVSFDPTNDFIRKTYKLFRTHNFTNFLVEVEVDTELGIGYELIWEGRIYRNLIKDKIWKYANE